MPPHRRYPTPGRESHESLSILVLQGQDTRRHEERMVTLAGHCGKGTPKLVRRSHLERAHAECQGRRRLLQLLQDEHVGSVGGIVEHREAGSSWDDFLQELQPFSAQLAADARQPGDVATRSREVGHEPGANRVRNNREDDGDRAGRLLGGQRLRRTRSDDYVHLETDELGGKLRQAP
jgi:hypothetical protein